MRSYKCALLILICVSCATEPIPRVSDTAPMPTPHVVTAAPTSSPVVIGRIVPPYPTGLESQIEWLLPGRGDDVFGFEIVVDVVGSQRWLWVLQRIDEPKSERPVWRLVATADLPSIAGEAEDAIKGCEIAGVFDHDTYALAQAQRGVWLEHILAAWRFDRATRTIQRIDPSGMRCIATLGIKSVP